MAVIDPALMPPQIQQLPRDHRGYPVPAESLWIDGVPDLGKQDYRRIGMLVSHNHCIVCGCFMEPGKLRYRLVVGAEAEVIRDGGGKCVMASGSGPKACMLYSGLTCPFFASPGGRRTSEELKGTPRGEKAVVMGFGTVLIALHEGPEGVFEVQYYEATDEIEFSRPEELVPLLLTETQLNPVDLSTQKIWTDTDVVTHEWKKRAAWVRSVSGPVQRSQ